MRTFSVACGEGEVRFRVAPGRVLGVLGKKAGRQRHIRALFKEALGRAARSILEGPLRDAKRVLAVVPDSTRKAHLKEILPLFMRLVPRTAKVDVIVATGLHLPQSPDEMERLLGKDICRHHRVTSHTQRRAALRTFGVTPGGVPIVLNKALGEYDAVVSFGVIEPHLYAGYSGGAKTVAIGLAGEETINTTHGPAFLDDRRVAIGSVDRNPFQRALRDITGRFPVVYSVNVVNDPDGNALRIFAGDPGKVFKEGLAYARTVYEYETRDRADIVICGVGAPKDANLYQASRSFNYILNVSRPILKEGGMIIVAAELSEGIGRGLGERRCAGSLRTAARGISRAPTPEECREAARRLIRGVRSKGCVGGEHRAYMIAKALLRATVVIVGARARRIASGLPLAAFDRIEDALRYAEAMAGVDSTIFVVPHALSTIAHARRPG